MTTFVDFSGLEAIDPVLCYGGVPSLFGAQRRCTPPVNPACAAAPARGRWVAAAITPPYHSACPPPSALCPPLYCSNPCTLIRGPCASPTDRRHCRAGGQEELQAAREGRPPPQTAYRPRLGNIAPRVQDWEARRGNTQTPPLTGPVRSRRCPLLACGKHAGLGTPRRLANPASSPCCPARAHAEQEPKAAAAAATGAAVPGAAAKETLITAARLPLCGVTPKPGALRSRHRLRCPPCMASMHACKCLSQPLNYIYML